MVFTALLVSLAVVLHALEALFPNFFPLPGAKLGLANIVTLLALMLFGFREAILVVVLRVVLGSLLGGTFLSVTFVLSFSGGVVSTVVMAVAVKYFRRLSAVGVSVLGAAFHNAAQLAAASVFMGTPAVFSYLPFLLLLSIPTGVFTGYTAAFLSRSLSNISLQTGN